jgi:hypothetical protein
MRTVSPRRSKYRDIPIDCQVRGVGVEIKVEAKVEIEVEVDCSLLIDH